MTDTRPILRNGRYIDVPIAIKNNEYTKRRDSGMTHEEVLADPTAYNKGWANGGRISITGKHTPAKTAAELNGGG